MQQQQASYTVEVTGHGGTDTATVTGYSRAVDRFVSECARWEAAGYAPGALWTQGQAKSAKLYEPVVYGKPGKIVTVKLLTPRHR